MAYCGQNQTTLISVVPKIPRKPKNLEWVTWLWPGPFHGWLVMRRLGLTMINLEYQNLRQWRQFLTLSLSLTARSWFWSLACRCWLLRPRTGRRAARRRRWAVRRRGRRRPGWGWSSCRTSAAWRRSRRRRRRACCRRSWRRRAVRTRPPARRSSASSIPADRRTPQQRRSPMTSHLQYMN